ncbi:hypothetical protein EDB89DRAFT_2147704 [Lactarius sanguifluus]|nr:hypothetical protein EDB89DRAFT_2147704 [Lactarius sanguifluus]
MNISIDDLVSSFSASHVSQEAMDIATLQASPAHALSLAATVMHSHVPHQPPTSATASFHWEWEDTSRFRGQNSTPYAVRSCDVDDEMADEQAVEDLLNVQTPMQSPAWHATTTTTTKSSHFANTDPFYLAAVQTAAIPTPPSFFAQAARLGPNSPFNLSLSAQQAHHTLEVESRTVLVGAGQGR